MVIGATLVFRKPRDYCRDPIQAFTGLYALTGRGGFLERTSNIELQALGPSWLSGDRVSLLAIGPPSTGSDLESFRQAQDPEPAEGLAESTPAIHESSS